MTTITIRDDDMERIVGQKKAIEKLINDGRCCEFLDNGVGLLALNYILYNILKQAGFIDPKTNAVITWH